MLFLDFFLIICFHKSIVFLGKKVVFLLISEDLMMYFLEIEAFLIKQFIGFMGKHDLTCNFWALLDLEFDKVGLIPPVIFELEYFLSLVRLLLILDVDEFGSFCPVLISEVIKLVLDNLKLLFFALEIHVGILVCYQFKHFLILDGLKLPLFLLQLLKQRV